MTVNKGLRLMMFGVGWVVACAAAGAGLQLITAGQLLSLVAERPMQTIGGVAMLGFAAAVAEILRDEHRRK